MPTVNSMTWWLAIVAAATVAFAIGGIWYAPGVFGRRWMALNNLSEPDLARRNMGQVFGVSFLLAMVMTINLALFLGPHPSFGFCVAAAAAAGVGWSAAGLGIIYLFEGRPLALC